MGTITLSETNQDVIKNILGKVTNVPMLPQVVMRLLTLIGNSDHSFHEVVKIVESDAALTARILRVSNSAAFFRGNQVHSVSKAILQLGEKMVAGIAIGSCTSDVFKSPLHGYESAEGELWDHSLRTAIASREIASKFAKGVGTDLAFTAGLLHDIGKAILSEFLKGSTREMAQKCDAGNTDFLQAEIEHSGTNHAAVGGVLASHWNLPIAIAEAIQHHHSPAAAVDEFRALVYAVHLGDLVAMMGGTGTGADTLAYKI
ncbi:MAG: HDOD domain-containing protein, partial [bacterium]